MTQPSNPLPPEGCTCGVLWTVRGKHGKPDCQYTQPAQPLSDDELRGQFKAYFEANLLDGDEIQGGQMLASEEVFEVCADYLADRERRLIAEARLEGGIAELLTVVEVFDTPQYRDVREGVSDRIAQLTQKLGGKEEGSDEAAIDQKAD